MKVVKEQNKDVPIQTAQRYRIRELEVEVGKLKSEVQYLESELALKNKAIKDFKKWQGRVASYNYKYWLTEGYKLIEELIDEQLHHDMLKFLCSLERYNKYKNKIVNLYTAIYKNAEKVKQENI